MFNLIQLPYRKHKSLIHAFDNVCYEVEVPRVMGEKRGVEGKKEKVPTKKNCLERSKNVEIKTF